MKILVTGVCGLIGSHLTEKLLKEGHEVVGFDNLSFGNMDNIKSFIDDSNFTFFGNDIREDFWKLSNYCECEVSCDCDLSGFDYVYHLASFKKTYPTKSKSYSDSDMTSSGVMSNNSKMIERIYEFVKEDNSKLIFTSTSDVYGNHKTFNENDSISFQPTNVERQSYALVKLYEEQFLLNKFNEGELNVSVARIFGCFSERAKSVGFYGGGHFPIFFENALHNKDIIIHGDGSQTRSMAYVMDIVNGLIGMMDNFSKVNGEILNLGSDEEMSILEHAKEIVKSFNSNSEIKFISEKEAYGNYKDIKRRFADTDKAKRLIGYKTEYKLKDWLNEVVDKYRSNND
tara:strand:- start:3744 stop:4772 length:1029 start_codon:yes stop_codon:yes gene_type:complete